MKVVKKYVYPRSTREAMQALGITQSTEKNRNSHQLQQFLDRRSPKKKEKVWTDGGKESVRAKLKKLREMLP
tara:strand:- start:48 stop:263 length:216 start_codon:yes stop_codon:yes gene_type:complete